MKIVTKILSIVCLLAVLACAFVPCMKLTGNYQETFGMLNQITAAIPEESLPMIEQLLETQNITIDIKGTLDSFSKLLEPLNDGEITIMDFVTVSQNCTEVANTLSGLPAEGIPNPMEGLDVPADNPMVQMYEGVNGMIISLAQIGAMLPMLSAVLLAPVGLFGLLAFFVVLRIILRLLGRRGLGVGVTFLALWNAAFMMGLPMVVAELAGEGGLPFGLEATNVPYIMVGCCIANCIIWAIGRGAKVKKVKEEVVVEVPAEPVAPVEPEVVEEVVEEVVAEETSEEETV